MFPILISVIIPCYNYGNFLADAVNSVIDQTYTNWECIIVDDGSTDNTGFVSKELVNLHSKVKYFYKENGGLSSARNYGINKANGEFICFLDADDLFDKEKLEKQILCFSKNSIIDIVYGHTMFFEKNKKDKLYNNRLKKDFPVFPKITGSGNKIIRSLIIENITVISAPLIKKSVFTRIGNFDTTYNSYEDWHFWFRCALGNCYFTYEADPLASTYISFGHESMMSNKRKMILSSIQLRKFMAIKLPLIYKPYNFYRLLRSKIKLFFI